MFLFFYHIFIRCYGFSIHIASLFNLKARLWKNGRKQWSEDLQQYTAGQSRIIWMHVASLGEFEQGRPVLEGLRADYPNHFLLLSFFSPSGYEIRKNYPGVDYVCYLPLDTKANALKFISIVQPQLAIFVKYEFWFNFLQALYQKNINTIFISTAFRSGQYFFKWYGKIALQFIAKANHIHVQNETAAKLLQNEGIQHITVSGDTRFDRVMAIKENHEEVVGIEKWIDRRVCVMAGSVWPVDEEMLIAWLQHQNKNICIITAQHQIDVQNLAQTTANQTHVKLQLYSEKNFADNRETNLLIIDSIGTLSRLYKYADIVYIGGGFGAGIHNILEAAVYGKVILFGPNYQRFYEAKQLLISGGAICIEDQKTLQETLQMLILKESERIRRGKLSYSFVELNKGATRKILKNIHELL